MPLLSEAKPDGRRRVTVWPAPVYSWETDKHGNESRIPHRSVRYRRGDWLDSWGALFTARDRDRWEYETQGEQR